MRNDFFQETLISGFIIILAVLLLNPFGVWMPNMFAMSITLLLLVIFSIFVGLVWKETPRDERENSHRMTAGRMAYIIGTAVIVLGIMVQSLRHTIDPWLVLSLTAMITSKYITLGYMKIKK